MFRSIEIWVLYNQSKPKNGYDFRKSKKRVEIGVRGIAPLESRNAPSWTLISSNSLRSELHTRAKIEFLMLPRMVRSRGVSRFMRGGRTMRPCFSANGVYENSKTLSFISLLSGAKWSYDWFSAWMLPLSCWWSENSETAPLSTVKQTQYSNIQLLVQKQNHAVCFGEGSGFKVAVIKSKACSCKHDRYIGILV